MTKEEFAKKLESDESLRKALEAEPMKVLQDNNVELSEEELTNIAGGGLPTFYKVGNLGNSVNSWTPGPDGGLRPPRTD